MDKILKEVGEAPVNSIRLSYATMEVGLVSETIATFNTLNIPETGLQTLTFH